ncbi:ferritin-like domain-containing protein [Flagellimonas crocea]|uniref:ferritin-like domain-containing protein n=1 Tax=Flagellimonas crocea TaxID=3067311 RepID=UPI00296FF78A|nr:PA2169 family four-helix-bundle protein [Muricauda sp. DH64]
MANVVTLEKKLNNLLRKTHDAEKGFNKAAEHAKSAALQNYFSVKAIRRHGFGGDLEQEILGLNYEVEKNGSPAGTIHRGWMDITVFFSKNTDHVMLEEAINGEKAAVEEYEELLNDIDLPLTTRRMLTEQMNKIIHDLATIKRLEGSI